MATITHITAISKIAQRPVGKGACLVVIYGEELGRKFALTGSSLTIGRSSKSDVQVDQKPVSRLHARIDRLGKNLVLTDLGSTNGTYVNDTQIQTHTLVDGDLVKIGHTIFKFLSGKNIEKAYHEEIYRLTTVDGLTGAYNKRYFVEMLERELSRCRRYHHPLSLLLFDVDHFKKTNDEYGHLAGDYVLRELAAAVRKKIRREDALARFGGEEFAVVLPETSGKSALVAAEKLRNLVEKMAFRFDKSVLPVTISIGIASTAEEETAAAFIKRADKKLYEAKKAGRNCSKL